MKYRHFNITDTKTYPREGEHVIVSNGLNVDIAYFVCSGEYQFYKHTSVKDDTFQVFDSFEVVYWAYIEE